MRNTPSDAINALSKHVIVAIAFAFTLLSQASMAGRELSNGRAGLGTEELWSRIPQGKANEIIDEYGAGAEAFLVAQELRKRHLRGESTNEDRGEIDRIAQDLASIPTQRRSIGERAQMSRSWKKVAYLIRDLEGPGDACLNYMEIAFALDPTDASLGRELKFQRDRKEIVEGRAVEAARIREARARGEEPEFQFVDFSNQN